MSNELVLPGEFLLELFRLALKDSYVLSLTIERLKSNWLPEAEERDFFTVLKYQAVNEKIKPSFGTLLTAARKNEALRDYIQRVQATELKDSNTIIKTFESFIRQAMFIELYDQAASFYNKGEVKKAYSLFTARATQLTTFSLTRGLFEPIFKGFTKRHTDRIVEASRGHGRMPTGIDGLDHSLNGGPERKELMCFLADSKGGKSFCLTHLGVNYARRGYGVAHFQLEGTGKQCKARYDSNWSGSVYHELKAGELEEHKFEAYKKIVNNLGRSDIWVYAHESFKPMTVTELRGLVIDLKNKQDIAVVIVDYVDLLNPDEGHYSLNDERFRQEKSMQMLKDLAMELDVLVITATQASSIDTDLLEEEEFVIKRQHLAEAKGKVRPVDYLISINRTGDERRAGTCRLYLEAVREHAADEVIKICQNLKRSRFYDRKKTIEAGYFEAA